MTPNPDLARRLFAELLGTFCLVFAGTGAIVINGVSGRPARPRWRRGGVWIGRRRDDLRGRAHLRRAYEPRRDRRVRRRSPLPDSWKSSRTGSQRSPVRSWRQPAYGRCSVRPRARGHAAGSCQRRGGTHPGSRADGSIDDRHPRGRNRYARRGVARSDRDRGHDRPGGARAGSDHRSLDEPRALACPCLLAWDWTNLWLYLVGPMVGALVGVAIYEALRGPAGSSRRACRRAASGRG